MGGCGRVVSPIRTLASVLEGANMHDSTSLIPAPPAKLRGVNR